MQHAIYRFGDFRLDPAARELSRGGELIALPASAFDCLVYLVEHRDRAVGRDELMAAVWGRADVTDTLLGQTVLRVRRTLGDSGDGQRSIRTVPRFGYRFVAEVDAEIAPPAGSATAEPGAPTTTQPAGASRPPVARVSRMQLAGLIAAALAVVVAVVLWQLGTGDSLGIGRDADGTSSPPPADGALVLPAVVSAPADWNWLRLGLMDLIADRLQRAQMRTVPSESVVGLLRGAGGDGDARALTSDPALAHLAAWRIRPEARFADGRWHVVLDAGSDSRRISADARDDDVVQAARAAADALLLKLGRTPPPSGGELPALDELMQRTRAAMLGDQFELARSLIRDAPPALRERPELVHRLAQIELRAGRYEVVDRLLTELLPRLSPERETALRGRALVTLAASHVRRSDAEAAGKAYGEAIALLEGRHEPAALGLAYLGRGLVAAMHDDLATATAELGRARIEMQGAGDALGIAQVDLNLGIFDLMRQRPADALSKLTASAERFQALGAREERVYTLSRIAEVENSLLEHERALATSDSFWPPDAHSGNERLRWELFLTRAQALLHVGRLGDAQALLDRLLADADPGLDRISRAKAVAMLAQVALARGNYTQAAEQAAAALGPALAAADPRRHLLTWHVRLRALRRLQRDDRAADETQRLIAWAAERPEENAWLAVYVPLAKAEQQAHAGDWTAAHAAYEEASVRAEGLAVPDDLVEVAHSYTLALIAHGDLESAQAVAGRIAPWAERDLRAAWAQARLFQALDQPQAWQQASKRAAELAGERTIALNGHEP